MQQIAKFASRYSEEALSLLTNSQVWPDQRFGIRNDIGYTSRLLGEYLFRLSSSSTSFMKVDIARNKWEIRAGEMRKISIEIIS